MIRIGVIGLGKMGISHYSIINSHPDVDVVGICDLSNLVTNAISKFSSGECFSHYDKMIEKTEPEGVIISTPTVSHAEIIEYALKRNIHVFVEKPFILKLENGKKLNVLAEQQNLVNQVGYHLRFVATFNEAKRLLANGVLGKVYHFTAETYGPVVVKNKGRTWRNKKSEGGGCLYDYASHVINLVNYLLGNPNSVGGTVFKKIYSQDVEDAVYSTLYFEDGLTGQIAVNWSDETFRKMTNNITILGKKGKIFVDRQECRIFLRDKIKFENLTLGWNIKYTTDLTKPVWFYLRGEEYSAQIDYFIDRLRNGETENINSFTSALETDKVIKLLLDDA